MSSKIVKGLAIAAGTGLAIGLGNSRHRPDIPTTPSDAQAPESMPEADPLEERLGSIETRLSAVESRPAPSIEPAKIAEIEDRFERQNRDIMALRIQMAETREKVAAVANVVERQFADTAKRVPAMVESVIASYAGNLRSSLTAEIQQSVDARLQSFERTIDNKVSARVAALEKALVDQSGVISALSQRALDSDANLQRLISAVERLCERAEGRSPAPTAAATREEVPFEQHLGDALKRPPAPPAPGFRPEFAKEDDERRPRHRLSGYRGL